MSSQFNWGWEEKQRLLKPVGSGRGFQSECTSLAGANVLGMPYLHEEEFQVLTGHDLVRREAVYPVTWPPGDVTTSKVAEVEVIRLCATGHASPRRRGFLLLQSQDEIFQGLDTPHLLQAGSPRSQGSSSPQVRADIMPSHPLPPITCDSLTGELALGS